MAHENWKCNDCETINKITDDKCICGNHRPAHSAPSNNDGHGSCAVYRCPMPGVFSDSLKGGGNWHCRWHAPYKDDPVHCARITEELLTNQPRLSGARPGGVYVNKPIPVLELEAKNRG